nr:HipA domain-containing protein [Collimonas antrihumi]
MAARCGIRVPESSLVQIGGRNILLVKRFDREGDSRVHFASARTMLIAEGVSENDMGYADIADLTRRLSKSPQEDCHELFRRMALNVCLENTDDHEKNHAFLFKERQWQLAPAYDIQPQLQGLGYQQLRIGDDGHAPTLSNVLSASKRFLLKKEAAQNMVAEILVQVRDWRASFAQDGVSEHDIEMCSQYVMRPSVLGSKYAGNDKSS